VDEAVEELFEGPVLISENLSFEIMFYIYFMKKMNTFLLFLGVCVYKQNMVY